MAISVDAAVAEATKDLAAANTALKELVATLEEKVDAFKKEGNTLQAQSSTDECTSSNQVCVTGTSWQGDHAEVVEGLVYYFG